MKASIITSDGVKQVFHVSIKKISFFQKKYGSKFQVLGGGFHG